jgi:hypothetical protein
MYHILLGCCVTVRWCVETRGGWFIICFVFFCLLQVSLQLLWIPWAAWSLDSDEGCFTWIVSSVDVRSSLFDRGIVTVRPIIQCFAMLVQGCSSRAVFRETLDCEWFRLFIAVTNYEKQCPMKCSNQKVVGYVDWLLAAASQHNIWHIPITVYIELILLMMSSKPAGNIQRLVNEIN